MKYRATLRDRIVVAVADRVLGLASREYRSILQATIKQGWVRGVEEATGQRYPNPPFTEPRGRREAKR